MKISDETLNRIPKDGSRYLVQGEPRWAGVFEVYWDKAQDKYVLPSFITSTGTINLTTGDTK